MRRFLAAMILGGLLLPPAALADSLTTVSQAANLALPAAGNTSVIVQMGSNNYAETNQTGAQNYAEIGQFGDANSARITQDSLGALAIYQQYGNGNQVTITQTGVRPQPIVVVQRR